MTIEGTPVKIILIEMGVYEETFPSMDHSEKYRAMNPLVIPGNPEGISYLMKTPDMVVTHAIIFRQYNFYRISPNLHFTADTIYHIGKASDLGDRCNLRCNHDDKHLKINPQEPLTLNYLQNAGGASCQVLSCTHVNPRPFMVYLIFFLFHIFS
jgi:hypothetical protein